MHKLPIFPALVATMLLVAATPGYAQNVDCRSCHVPGKAADFSAIYTHAAAHHPVGIVYPLTNEHFSLPNGQSGDGTFFDKNANGRPDSDEIQLFGVNGAATITCASCHREHGATPLPAKAPRDVHLRVSITNSALCSTCHNQ